MIHTTKTQFANGLTLILVETHQAPVVSINICVRVGSRYESEDEAGLSHVLEHMLFKGTKKLAPGEVAKRFEASGGDINAYTSFDETVYYGTLSSRFRDQGLEILSDAVLNSVIDPVELERETEVVIEEILRGKDSPGRLLSEALFEKAYVQHHYRRPIIGFESTVRAFSRDKVYDFYRRWYVPENLVVVVAGDFKTDDFLKRCEEIFASLPATPSPREKLILEPVQNSTKTFALQKTIQGPSLMLGYHVPQLDHEDIPALDMLSHILGEGESARLEINVKDKQALVNSISSYVYTPQHPGLMVVNYTLPEKNVASATRAVFHEIEKIKDDGIIAEELNRARINIKSDAIYEKETVEGFARKYGYFETILRKHDFDEHYYQHIDLVTREQVQEVAQKYLQNNNLTLGIIQAQNARRKVDSGQLASMVKAPKVKKAAVKRRDEIQWIKLKNGLRLVLRENHQIPTMVIRTAHAGGLRSETPATSGINALLTQVWGKSSEYFDSHAMAAQVDSLAGRIDAYNGRNITGMKADFLSEKMHDGLRLFLEAFLRPRWDVVEIQKEKFNILEAIRREDDAPSSITFHQFLKALYPQHPYGMPLLGTTKTIQKFSPEHLKSHWQRLLNPKNTVIAIAGDFYSENILETLVPALEKIKVPAAFAKPKADPAVKKFSRLEKELEKLQAHIVYGFRGLSFYDPDRYALEVLNNVLAGQGGRLFLELRDKMSLAYSVTAVSQEGIEPGYFGVYIGTEGSKVDQSIAAIEQELKKIQKSKISLEELTRAKQYMIGSYEIDLQRNASVANHLAFNEVYGLDREEWRKFPQKIQKVTREDVARVVERVIRLDKAVLSIVRPKPERAKKSSSSSKA